MSDVPRELTSDEIVKMLKSADGVERAKAIGELYPGESVALVNCTHIGQISLAVPDGTVLPSLFSALVFACQRVGEGIGLDLRWVQTPQDAAGKILVAPGGGQMPLMR